MPSVAPCAQGPAGRRPNRTLGDEGTFLSQKPVRSATFFQKTLGYSPGCCTLGQLMWCQVKTDCYFVVSTAVGPNRFLLMTSVRQAEFWITFHKSNPFLGKKICQHGEYSEVLNVALGTQ